MNGRRGFFAGSELAASKRPPSTIAKCGACGLYKQCRSPKMPVSGEGRRGVLIVGEAPGKNEDRENLQFVGDAGKLLSDTLRAVGVDFRRDCWVTNAIICFTGDTRVESPSVVQVAYRRKYSGLLVNIKTASGRNLTGTPNHPVLTPFGWIALGLLKEGDDVIRCSVGQGTGSGGPYVNNPPPRFDQLFSSLAKTGDVHGVIGSRMDFHGDGEDGDVDVICADGFLRDGMQSSKFEHMDQFKLKPAGHRKIALFGNGRRTKDTIELTGGSFSTAHGFVCSSCQSKAFLSAESTHANFQSFAGVAEVDSCTFENVTQSIVRDSQRRGEGCETLPIDISTDRVVKVEVKPCYELCGGDCAADGSTHVYNLQTENGYYLADGIVVSNCRPPDNRTPTPKEVEYCRPNLLTTLKQLKPKTVICLGGTAVRSVVGYTWKENVGAISRWVGWNIPDRTLNAWICPTYHPSYLNRTGEHPLLFKFFKEHLAQAFTHDDRPWPDGPPDLREQIEIEEDVDRAARVLDWMRERGGPIAFDYESNALKPDDERAIIVSCAVCWRGKRTIAYPWQGRAIDATRRLLRSDCPKIGANIKHEDRWTRTKLGCAVRNWVWCCLIGAHVLDNRPDITSVKFQSYVHLGMPSYNDPLEKYLKSGKNTSFNRILSEVSMVQLLEYNGLDALLEYMLAIKQAKLMKFKLFDR